MAATLPILLAIAGVVLLLTCANVATLTLVRFVSRRREIAIRQSLGAQRVQLVRQMVLEGVILSAGAGAVALLLTSMTAKTFARFIPANSNPIALNGTVDQNVVIGIVMLAALASVLCGALPAWRSSNVPAAEALKDESSSISGGSHNRRLLSGLVVAQIALSLALLVISGLFLQTLRNLSAGDPGFEQDHVLTASVGLAIAGYSDDEEDAISHKILDRVSALPTVTVASLTDWIPMNLIRKTEDAYPEGYAPRPHESLEVQHADVTPRYFETLGVPILEGRDFAQYDNRKAPLVAIVDQTAANRFWPGQDPVGKRLHMGNSVVAVIGVVKNTKHEFMNERPAPMVYMSYFQRGFENIVQVRTQGNPNDIATAVERAIHEIDGRAPVFDVRSMRETTQMATIFAVMQSTFAGILAAIALDPRDDWHLWCSGVPHGISHARDRHPHRTWRFARRRSEACFVARAFAHSDRTQFRVGALVQRHALHCRVSLRGGSQRSSDGHRGCGIACGDVGPRMLLPGATRDARRSRSCHTRVVNESDFAPRLSASHREGRALQRSRR